MVPQGELAVIWDLAAAINVGSWRSSWCSNLGRPGLQVSMTDPEAGRRCSARRAEILSGRARVRRTPHLPAQALPFMWQTVTARGRTARDIRPTCADSGA